MKVNNKQTVQDILSVMTMELPDVSMTSLHGQQTWYDQHVNVLLVQVSLSSGLYQLLLQWGIQFISDFTQSDPS